MSIMRLSKKSVTALVEEQAGEIRWTDDAMSGADLDYIATTLPVDVIDWHLFEWGWTKVEENGEHRYWRSPDGCPTPSREEAFRIACIGRAEASR